jgi:hypothetical protein
MACLDEPTVLALIGGRIAESEAATIDSHLESCRACRELVVAVARTTLVPPRADAGDAAVAPGERYRLVELIGHGAQGLVYAADDTVLARRVAIKLLRPDAGGDRILDEARLLARVTHPNIVTVHDAGVTADGAIYLAMEYVDAGTLASWLATPRAPAEVLRVCADAGRGLAAAHAAGIVHRDVKPANILVGADGRARITDFGLATAPASRTSGSIVGTPAYMAPEQLAGEASAASDQFALAVTAWEALTGASPFTGRTLEARAAAILAGPRPPAKPLPARVEAALRRALGPEPDARFASVDALVAALASDPRPRRRAIAAGVLAAGAIAAAIAAVAISRRGADPCAGVAGELAGTWDAAVAAKLDAAFAASPLPYAARAGADAKRRLDGYATAWSAARTRTCRAGGAGSAAAASAELSRQCLWERRGALAAAAATLAIADAAATEHATELASALPAIALCENVAYLRERVPPPVEPVAARKAADATRLATESAAARVAGKLADARRLAEEARRIADEIGHAPLQARAALELGLAHVKHSDLDAAEASLRAATIAAQRGKEDAIAAAAWAELVHVVGYGLGRHEDGLRYAELADATIRRIGGDDRLRSTLDLYRCSVLDQMGRAADAAVACAAARTARIAALGPDDHTLSNIDILEARLRVKQGDVAAANQLAADALARREGALGADHPSVVEALFTLAQVASWQGELERGEAAFVRATELALASFGADSIVLASLWSERAQLETYRGAFDAALASNEKAIAIREKLLGPAHIGLVFNLTLRGRIHEAMAKLDDARTAFERALAIVETAGGPDHPDVIMVLLDLGRIHVAQGKAALGREQVERALSIAKRLDDQLRIASATSVLGELEVRAGALRDALAHFQQALSALDAIYGPDSPQSFSALLNTAIVNRDLGRPRDALPAVARALAIEEKSAGADALTLILPLEVLGDVQLALGDRAAARAAWERAVGLPDVPAEYAEDIAAIRAKLSRLRR